MGRLWEHRNVHRRGPRSCCTIASCSRLASAEAFFCSTEEALHLSIVCIWAWMAHCCGELSRAWQDTELCVHLWFYVDRPVHGCTAQAVKPRHGSKQGHSGQAVKLCQRSPGDPTPDTEGPSALRVACPVPCPHELLISEAALQSPPCVLHHGIISQLAAIYRSPSVCRFGSRGLTGDGLPF